MTGRLDYWVEVSAAGRPCGAGFLVTRCFVLTAAHCLRNKADEEDIVMLSRAGSNQAKARVIAIDRKHDVALIQVIGDLGWQVLEVGTSTCVQGDDWFAPYRPAKDRSELKGSVLTASLPFECAGGGTIDALELQVIQLSGNYSGYSGSPVERRPARRAESRVRAVVGILIEQDPHRVRREEFTNVLFAATILQAMGRFDVFRLPPLVERLEPALTQEPAIDSKSAHDVEAAVRQTFVGLRAVIAEIHALVEDGVIPLSEATRHTRESVRHAAKRAIDGSADGRLD